MKIKIEFISGNGKVFDSEKCTFIAHKQDGDYNSCNEYIASIIDHELREHEGKKLINWDAVESIREWKD